MNTPSAVSRDLRPHKQRLTVIIPVYNREKLIVRCLDSVAAQSYRPLRVIVVDNNSSDGTASAVARWIDSNADPALECILTSEARQGAAAARRHGLQFAFQANMSPDSLSEPVSFFDSDDMMRPDFASKIMECFILNPDSEVVVFPRRLIELSGATRISKFPSRTPELSDHLVHSILATLSYAARAKVFFSAGNWNPAMRVWDDLELGVRVMLTNPRITRIPYPLADIYSQEVSITGTGFSQKASLWEATLDEIDRVIRKSRHPQTARLLRITLYRRIILASFYAREGRQDLAAPLMASSLGSPLLSPLHRGALRFAYAYTRRKLRGAFSLIGWML